MQQLDDSAALASYLKAAGMLAGVVNADLRQRAAHGAFALGLRLQRERIASGDDIDGEVAAFQAAHDLDAENQTFTEKLADARCALGDQYLADLEYKEAAYAYQRAYELDKYDSTYKQKAVDAFVAWGDQQALGLVYNSMIEAYGNAFKIDRSNEAVKQKLADAYNARGEDYRAMAVLTNVQSKYKLALLDFKEALHLFPDDAAYRANYDALSVYDT